MCMVNITQNTVTTSAFKNKKQKQKQKQNKKTIVCRCFCWVVEVTWLRNCMQELENLWEHSSPAQQFSLSNIILSL